MRLRDADLVPWILWRLWKKRNELRFRGHEYEAESIVMRAKEDVEEWKRRKEVEISEAERMRVQRPTINNSTRSWIPPPSNWLKCNTDGAWRKDKEHSGLGWLCRDEYGRVIWAGARAVTQAASPILAEAEALKSSAEVMARFGYMNVIFESDSLSLVNMISGLEEVWSVLRPTIEMIRSTMSHFHGAEMKFYPRGVNKTADRIAKESFTFVSSVPKLCFVVPLWLKYQVRADIEVYGNNHG